jgi:tripartite-type tricarboxylate transporter receptor subunit TctC
VTSVPLVKAGRLKAIALTLPTPLLPGTPTMAQAGLKGFDYGFWYGVVAPAGTPRAVVERASREIARSITSPSGRSELNAIAVDAVGSTPAEFAATIRNDILIWGKVARALGLKPE